MIGEFAFHLIGAELSGIRHLGMTISLHPGCVVHQKTDFVDAFRVQPTEIGDPASVVKNAIDKFQIACWRKAGSFPGRKWGHQTTTGDIGRLLDISQPTVPAVDSGWYGPNAGFDPVDYFICRCIRVPTILIVRDGRAAISAQITRDKISPEVAVARWKFAVYVTKRAMHFLERTMVVRLEDVITRPKISITAICDFLEISYTDAMIKNLNQDAYTKAFRKYNQPTDDLNRRAATSGWLDFIEADLRMLGYLNSKISEA